MADLDTTNKRRSGLQVMRPPFGVMVEPTGLDGLGRDDRQHLALMYGGILAASGASIFTPYYYHEHIARIA
jgi:hypothetical protein